MAEQNSKELVRGLFNLRELPRVPFIPWICTFAAQLEQISAEEMLSDPGMLSTALLNAQRLFGYDAIVTVFDPSLEAEACGCKVEWPEDGALPRVISHPLAEGLSPDRLDTTNLDKSGRIPIVLEAMKRINIIAGKQSAVLGMITGPIALARHLKGRTFLDDLKRAPDEAAKTIMAVSRISLTLSRKFCELGVDAIVIADDQLGRIGPALHPLLAAQLKSIWNIANFYGVHSMIITTDCTTDSIEPILDLQAEGVALGANADGASLREAATKQHCCYGLSVANLVLNTPSELIEYTRDCLAAKTKGCFITTDWEVPYATSVETMHEAIRIIRSHG